MELAVKKCLIITKDAGLKKEINASVSKNRFNISCVADTKNLYSTLKKSFNALILDIDDITTDIFLIIDKLIFNVTIIFIVDKHLTSRGATRKGLHIVIRCDAALIIL